MPSAAEQIQAASARNASLLHELADTDYAVAALQQQIKLVNELKRDLASLDKQLRTLETKRKSELKDHERYQKSVIKRFAYKATGQKELFAAKAEKEEKEYFDALTEEHKAKTMRGELQHQSDQAEQAQSELEKVVQQHNRAQSELDTLYDSIFDGATPEFPEEDEAERSAEQVLQTYHSARTQWESASQSRALLDQAATKMRAVLTFVAEARSYSGMDMFGGGSLTDMMERNALHTAETNMMEVQMLLVRAKNIDPQVGDLPAVNFAKGHLMSDVFFDNIFTDMAFHDKIKASQAEAERAAGVLQKQREMAASRLAAYKGELAMQEARLKEAREGLQRTRMMVFTRMTEQAPAYAELE